MDRLPHKLDALYMTVPYGELTSTLNYLCRIALYLNLSTVIS